MIQEKRVFGSPGGCFCDVNDYNVQTNTLVQTGKICIKLTSHILHSTVEIERSKLSVLVLTSPFRKKCLIMYNLDLSNILRKHSLQIIYLANRIANASLT